LKNEQNWRSSLVGRAWHFSIYNGISALWHW
jgi:hypothetical protein